VAEFGNAEEFIDVFSAQRNGVTLFLHDFAGDLAADIADLALQVAHPSFTRVRADDLAQSIVSEGVLLFRQASGLTLFAYQELTGNFNLFELGVSVQPQDFHAVLQRSRNGVQHVGSGNEEDLGQIVLHVKVVVLEHPVLLRIKNLKQSSG